MKNIYLYTPEICDGDYCSMDCTYCPKRHAVEEKRAEEEDDDA